MCSQLSVICHCLNISHIDLVTAIVDKIWNGSQMLMCWKLGPQHVALLEVAKAFRGRDGSDGKKLGHRRGVLDEEPWFLVLFLLFASWPSGLGQFTVLTTSPGWNASLLSWKQLKQVTTEWSLWHCKAKHTPPPLWYLSGIFHNASKLTNKILMSFLLGQILWQGVTWEEEQGWFTSQLSSIVVGNQDKDLKHHTQWRGERALAYLPLLTVFSPLQSRARVLVPLTLRWDLSAQLTFWRAPQTYLIQMASQVSLSP